MNEPTPPRRPIPFWVVFMFVCPFWCCNGLFVMDAEVVAPYDGGLFWYGQFFLSAIVVGAVYYVAGRFTSRTWLRALMALVGIYIWLSLTLVMNQLSVKIGYGSLVEKDLKTVRAWTGGNFPPDCKPEYDDSSYTITWNCGRSMVELGTYFRTNLGPEWKVVKDKPEWNVSYKRIRFVRSVPHSKRTDEIEIYDNFGEYSGLSISPHDTN